MIEVKNLKKYFFHKNKKIVAVDDVSFSIKQGESVAFIGPNGAGKSTTIKMLTGIIWPTEGHISVLGISPQDNRKAVVSQVGVVFGQRSSLLPNLPPSDSLKLFGIMYGLNKKETESRIKYLEEQFDLTSFKDQPVRTLSLGQRMRVEIACSIIHNPKILFLDEPSIGLDIIAKKNLRETLAYLRKEHKMTIFLTSHDVGDIEAICDRTIVINHGKVVVDEPTNELYKLVDREKKMVMVGPSLEEVLTDLYKK